MKKLRSLLYPLAIAAVIAAAWYISNYHYQILLINGDSMAPTYRSMSFAVVDRHKTEYVPGDVVLFRCDSVKRNLVKRIAAVPGDTVCERDGRLIINGLDIAPMPESERRNPDIAAAPFTLPGGEYLMLGDNIDYSVDSRYAEIGFVRESQFIGKLIT